MPWQRYVYDVALEVMPNGDWAYDEVVATVERQAGKTTMIRPVVVHRCSAADLRRVFLTAQTRKHARRRWMDATDALLTSRLLRAKLKRKVSNGFEELRWISGQSTFEPFAPNEGDMHGETPDLVVIDELWAFNADEYAALAGAYEPGFLTKNAQTWKLSTAGTAASAALNDARVRGRRAVEMDLRRGTAYFEWSLPDQIGGIEVEELDDAALLAAVLEHHPANCQDPNCPGPSGDKPGCPHGFTLRPAAVANAQAKATSRGDFLRPYGNRSTERDTDRIIPVSAVMASTTLARIPEGVVPGISFDVDPDRRVATIAAGWRGPDGQALVEIVEHGLGTRWLAAAVAGVLETQGIRHVTANNAGPARDVADELERAGYEIQRVTAPDYAAACVRFHDEIKATPRPSVQHYGQADLVEAFSHLAWRKLGQSLAFTTVGEPVTPVTAATLAVWAADHPPEVEPPLPRSRIY